MNVRRCVSTVCGLLFATAISFAATAPVVTYHFDEFGNGFGMGPGGSLNLPGALAFDPGPGGLASALTYSGLGNPPSLVAGDVLLFEPGVGNTLSDIIRFNPAGTGGNPAYRPSLVFYSDNADVDSGVAPADSGFPIAFYANTVNVREALVGPGTEVAVYTPLAGQPGFVAGFDVTYTFVSDSPEPASLGLCAVGIFSVVGINRRRKRTA